MKLRLVWLFPVIIFFNLYGQVVTTEPQFPTMDDSIVVYFNLQEATRKDLVNFSGDLYVHTGVITDKSSDEHDWKGVIAKWNTNIPKAKLTFVSDNYYKLTIGFIKDYYTKTDDFDPATDKIESIAFVVRNSNGSLQTENIYLKIYEAGLNTKFTNPDSPQFLKVGENILLQASGTSSDSLVLYIDKAKVASSTSNSIEYNYQITSAGKKEIIVTAFGSTGTISDSTYIYTRTDNNVVSVPSGVDFGINYIDANTVTLALYGNSKEFIYVIGDFNDWQPDENYQMNISPDGTIYWITISNLDAGKEYAFQYYVEGKLKLADPYADKVLDSWNDEFISSSTYPGLKTYPDKAEGIVSVFQTNQTNYSWQVSDFVKPDKEDLVIYELLVRDFIKEHDYKTLIDTLDYFTKLGINAIELMPINEFEGNSSWGYNPSFLFAPDKYYGPKNDLKKFIDECHKRGIAVILDIVLNHSYGQSPFVQMYFESGKPSAENPWFNVNHNFENTDAHWGYDFNHESVHTQTLVDRITKYWLTEYKFDGFRFDFTKGFSNNWKSKTDDIWASKYDADRIRLLKRMTDKIREVDPNAYVIFEHLSENSEEKELVEYGILLWGNMNHNYNEASMGYNESNKSNLTGALYTSRDWSQPNLISYMESHDEERLMYKNLTYGKTNSVTGYSTKNLETALARQMLVSAFFYTLPGPKMLWQFGEVGYDYSINENGRVGEKPIRWDYYEEENRRNLYKVTSELIKLKTRYDVFRTTDIKHSLTSTIKRLHLTTDTLKVTVVGNFDVAMKDTDPNFQETGWWYDFFSGDSIYVSNVNDILSLTAGEFHIYTSKKLETPEQGILTAVEELSNNLVETFALGQNYPNPFNPSTTFKYQIPDESDVKILIYNSLGEVVKTLVDEPHQKGAYKVVWDGSNTSGQKVSSGVYFYQLRSKDFSDTKKMLLVK